MRDKTYFNKPLFTHTNSVLHETLMTHIKLKKTTLFYVIDEAIREYLKKGEGETLFLPEKPIYPNL